MALIADEVTHQALAYVAAVTRQGYALTVPELEAFAQHRRQRAVGGLYSLVLSNPRDLYAVKSVPSVMRELGWVNVSGGRVSPTALGLAVLRALDEEAVAEGIVTVLPADDPIAYAKVINAIAGRGKGMLVDPYFRLDDLPYVQHYTEIERLMVGPRADVKGLAVAAETVQLGRPFEIRVSDEIHDRFVIPDSGPVDHLGQS